jgi:hypothetical protein
MAKQDFYPTRDPEKLTFWANFYSNLTTVGPTVGLEAADIALMADQKSALENAINNKLGAKAYAQSATAACTAVDGTAEDALRAMVRRIKAHPSYTTAVGEQLGIEGPQASPPAGDGPRPDLREASVVTGEVTIGFAKQGFSGVEIQSKRGAETAFSFLARDTESPYVDTRANLAAAPETRYYQAQFLQKDALVGQWSDVLVVTVPGTV